MNFLRKIIRLIAIPTLVGVVIFHIYMAVTDVDKSDLGEAIESYAVSCSVPRQAVIDLFSHVAANAAKVPSSKIKESLLSEYKIRVGQANLGDFLLYAKYKLQQLIGYNHGQRVEQISMKAGIQALEEHGDKCDLSSVVFSMQRIEKATSAPASTSKKTVSEISSSMEPLNELSEAAREAISAGFVDIENSDVEACVDAKIASIRKEYGEEQMINYQVHNEIAVQCGFNI